MQLKNYKILDFKEKDGDMVIEFTFDDGSKSVQTISYNHDMAYSEVEFFNQEIKYVDDEGVIRTRIQEMSKTITKYKKPFDLNNKEKLNEQIMSYAAAYIDGIEKEKAARTVPLATKSLVGIEKSI